MSLMPQTATTLKWWLLITGVFILSVLLQIPILTHGMINGNSSWLMHLAQRLLAGGKYYQDFFETNPPISIYLYVPVLTIAKVLGLGLTVSLYIYGYAIAVMSLGLSGFLSHKIFPTAKNLTYLLIVALLFAYTILPSVAFGEREHIAIMLIVPYVFYNMLRLSGGRINWGLACIIALLAGIGFIIKPYFILPLVMLELYVWLNTKGKKLNWAPEIVIGLVYLSYAVVIFGWHQEYLKIMLPFNWHFYALAYSYCKVKWYIFFIDYLTVFVEGILIFYLIWRRYSSYKVHYDILALVILGFAIIGFFTPAWYYHALPMVMLSCLLIAWLLWDFFHVIYGSTLVQSRVKIIILIMFIVAVWYLPIRVVFDNYVSTRYAVKHHAAMPELVKFFKQYPNARIFAFSFCYYPVYPLVDYANVVAPARFLSLELLVGILKDMKNHPAFAMQQQQMFNQMVQHDLQRYSPDFVFVDTYWSRYLVGDKNFDFIKYYSQYPWFVQWWRQYHWVKHIGQEDIYAKNPLP